MFGDDYATPDGTGVRDYIHVVDLARGHLRRWTPARGPGMVTCNLGTGRGYSVLEMIRAFEQASGRPVPIAWSRGVPGIRHVLCGPEPGPRRTRLAGGTWNRRHGARSLALATCRSETATRESSASITKTTGAR